MSNINKINIVRTTSEGRKNISTEVRIPAPLKGTGLALILKPEEQKKYEKELGRAEGSLSIYLTENNLWFDGTFDFVMAGVSATLDLNNPVHAIQHKILLMSGMTDNPNNANFPVYYTQGAVEDDSATDMSNLMELYRTFESLENNAMRIGFLVEICKIKYTEIEDSPTPGVLQQLFTKHFGEGRLLNSRNLKMAINNLGVPRSSEETIKATCLFGVGLFMGKITIGENKKKPYTFNRVLRSRQNTIQYFTEGFLNNLEETLNFAKSISNYDNAT